MQDEQTQATHIERATLRAANPFWRGVSKFVVAGAAALVVFTTPHTPSLTEQAHYTIDDNPKKWVVQMMEETILDAHEGPSNFWSRFGNVHFEGKTSSNFQKDIQEAWDAIPLAFREMLKANKYSVLAGPSVSVIKPFLGVIYDPTDDRSLPNHALGMNIEQDKEILVTEFNLSTFAEGDRSRQDYPSPQDLVAMDWSYQKGSATQGTVRHETGHAVNHSIKNILGSYLSDMPDFVKSYEADLQNMGGPEGAMKKNRDYEYYADPKKDPTLCRNEVFAELLAQKLGGGARDKIFAKDWSTTAAYVSSFADNYIAAHNQGLKQALLFIDGLDGRVSSTGSVRPSVSSYGFSLLQLCRKTPSWNELKAMQATVSSSLPEYAVKKLLGRSTDNVDDAGATRPRRNGKVVLPKLQN